MKTIVVTGGSAGIGKAIIERLSGPDVTLVSLSRDEAKGQAAAKALNCRFIACDVSDYASVDRAIAQVIKDCGPIEAVVNDAGLWIEGPLDDNQPERMRDVILTNTLGVLNVSHAVVPGMKAAGRGTIINISSSAGLTAKPERVVYDASKWGVTGLGRALQLELAPFGIRVTTIYPSTTETGLFDNAGNPKPFNHALEPDDVAQAVEFVLKLDPGICIPDLSIKHL